MFKKWYTACFKTYADVFIRLAAIYFALYLINLLTKNPEAFTINGQPLGLAETLFVILGILMFAKQFPDLLKDLLGIDLKGNFTLNPMKKIGENAPLAAAALGLGAGAVGGMVGNFMASRQTHSGFFKGLKHTVGGAFTGAARGAHAGYGSKGSKLFGTSWNAAGKGGQNIINKQGTSFVGRNVAKVQAGLGIHTRADDLDERSKAFETFAGFKDQIKAQADLDDKFIWDDGSGNVYTGVKKIKEYYEDLKNSGTASQAEITAAREKYEDMQTAFINSQMHDTDTAIGMIVQQATSHVKANSSAFLGGYDGKHRVVNAIEEDGKVKAWSDFGAFKAATGESSSNNTKLKTTPEWDTAHANQSYAKTGSSGKK